jgi:hypothetical protein
VVWVGMIDNFMTKRQSTLGYSVVRRLDGKVELDTFLHFGRSGIRDEA